MDGIKITLNEVSATAGTIRSLNQQLTAKLEEIKAQMDGLASTWQSDASDTIRSKFSGLQPRFEEYREVVENYARFLDSTVQAYETAESNINNNASMFK